MRKIYTGDLKIVVARKAHVCSEHSYHRISIGDRYLLMAMAPWHEMNDGKKWVRRTVCLRCADEYGMHNNETRKQMEPPAGESLDDAVPGAVVEAGKRAVV